MDYMKLARTVAENTPCTRRQCGAILVKDGAVLSTGYNGSCRGSLNCGTKVPCLKDIHKEAPLASYVHCPAVHGEENAIINAARTGGTGVKGSTMYFHSNICTDNGRPCRKCRERMINAGIKDIYFENGKFEVIHETIEDWLKEENEWMESEKNA